MKFYKYQAAGNDFIMIDETNDRCGLTEEQRALMCHRRFGVGADGVIYLRLSDGFDFEMIYHNSDGKEASMCGNGGRAIVRFAHDLGLIGNECHFMAVDGKHSAIVRNDLIDLQMQDVEIPLDIKTDLIQTGSPHFVKTVDKLSDYNVVENGRALRYSKQFSPKGCNVNFIEEVTPFEIHQRTYERGVENETYACGTGAVAGAVYQAVKHNLTHAEIKISMKGGLLRVKFNRLENKFTNVWLCGPAEKVFEGIIRKI